MCVGGLLLADVTNSGYPTERLWPPPQFSPVSFRCSRREPRVPSGGHVSPVQTLSGRLGPPASAQSERPPDSRVRAWPECDGRKLTVVRCRGVADRPEPPSASQSRCAACPPSRRATPDPPRHSTRRAACTAVSGGVAGIHLLGRDRHTRCRAARNGERSGWRRSCRPPGRQLRGGRHPAELDPGPDNP